MGLFGLGRVTFSVYVLGLVSSPLGVPKVSLRHPAKDGFLLRLSPDLGGVWLFCIHCREVAALGLSGLGCVTFSVYVLGLVSSPLGAPKVSLRHAAKDGFLLRLSPDLDGVWLFCTHRREVAALGLSGLGCVTFSVYVLGLVSSPLGAPKVSLRHAAKDGFLLRLSPDLDGVWLFCIHCREVAALGLSGLGCVTFSVYVLGLVSSPLGAPKVSLRHAAKDGFLLRLSPDLDGVWLFCIHRREVAALGLSGLGCVTFSVYVLGLVSSPLRAPKVSLRHAAKDGFLLRLSPDLDGVWLFCIHRREVAALGLSGLGCVTFSVYVLGLVSSPLGAPKVSLRHAAKDGFLLRLSPDLDGVWLFCIHRREVAALGLSGLGCVTFSVYVLGLVSSPLGAPKVSLRHAAKDGFLLRLSPDLDGVWLFCIHRREVAALGLSGLGCVTFSVYVLGLVSSPLGAPKVSLRHPAKDGFLLRLSPDLGGVWLFCIHRREVAALGLSGLGCVTFSVYVLGLVSSPLGVERCHFGTLRRTVFCFV